MPPALRLPFGLAAGCAAIFAFSIPAHGIPEVRQAADVPQAAAMQEGPEALQALLARYDKEAAGPAKDKLAAEIDRVAHQKYATVSRLYWYTDFAAAQAAARASKKPILHLRMLGKLDEDLSCANSRLFRATLYANQDISAFLRDRFVLYWSSERPVPKVTIDYGDGRKIERTTTGNSAHYVLDADGNVLDVLPGLYAPIAFRKELTDSLALAERVRGASAADRAKLIVAYHQAELKVAETDAAGLVGTPYLSNAAMLLTDRRVEAELTTAQKMTVTKSGIEVSDLRYITAEIAPSGWSEEAIGLWASAGQMLYGIGDLKRAKNPPAVVILNPGTPRYDYQKPPLPAPPRVLDDSSAALVSRLHQAVSKQVKVPSDTATVITRLEQNLVADTALNQLRVRPAISREIVRLAGRVDFATLNTWVYANAFHTPKTDPWLGLLPRTDFTGLPGDGVVMR